MRLYLSNDTAGATPPSYRGSWTLTTGTVTRALDVKAGAAATVVCAHGTASALHYRGVSAPFLSAGTLSGTFSMVAGVLTSVASNNAKLRGHLYVMAPDGSVRGTLLSSTNDSVNLTTTGNGRAWAPTVGSVACLAGDRLVFEFGTYSTIGSVGRNSTVHYGNTGGTDLTAGSTSVTTQPGWIEMAGLDPLFVVGVADTAALAATVAVTADGAVAASGAASLPATAATTAAGVVGTSGTTALPVAVATSAAGLAVTSDPTAAVTVTAAPSATGRVGRLGSAARAVAVATTATGSRGVAGSAARSVSAATTAAGVVQLPPGSATAAVAAAVTASGAVSAAGGTGLPVAVATTAAGVVRVPRDITLLASLPDRSKVGVLADRPNRVVVLADRPDAGLLTTHPLLVAVTGARRAAARLDDQKERP